MFIIIIIIGVFIIIIIIIIIIHYLIFFSLKYQPTAIVENNTPDLMLCLIFFV